MDSNTLKFELYHGPTGELYTDPNHLVFKWRGPATILFSVAKRGQAVSVHFSSDKQGLRHLKTVLCDFFDFVLWLYPWCNMVIAQVKRDSVARLIQKIGFKHVGPLTNNLTAYARARLWDQ